MQKAAKEKVLKLIFAIASVLFLCAPSTASSTSTSGLENRVELFLLGGENRTEPQAFGTANRVENYDSFWGTALESSVAPKGVAGRVVSGGCFVPGTPVRLCAEPAMATIGDRAEATTTTANAKSPATTTAIEYVALGARVPDQNPRPEGYDFSLRDVDQETWRQVDVRLRRNDGAVVEMQLLRPVEWVENLNLSVGSEFKLILSEFEVDGNAVVTAIGVCCEIAIGEGSVVTGRFVTRQVSNLVEVTLENGTIFTGTTTHPVWIPEKHGWVELGDLQEGEQLETLAGPMAAVAVRRPTQVSDVFNIEVHGHHVYRITEDGVLVHNNSSLVVSRLELASGLDLSGAKALSHIRKHAGHARDTARRLGLARPDSLDDVAAFLGQVVKKGETRIGTWAQEGDVLISRLGDAVVIRKLNGQYLTNLDFSKGGNILKRWTEGTPMHWVAP